MKFVSKHALCWSLGFFLSAATLSATAQIAESFRGNTLTQSWLFPGSTNLACLTVAGGTRPCAGTVLNYNDTSGNGWLRFTSSVGNQQGTAILNSPLSLNGGFSITFTYAMYSGTQADGISIFFIDPSAANAGTGGAYGGGLGYCQIAGGIIGIGIDEYGNFPNTGNNNCNGTGPGFQNSNFSVRGGAKATTPWLFLTGSGLISNTALLTDGAWTAPATGTCSAASCQRTGTKIQVGFFPDPTCNPVGQYRLTITPLSSGSTIPAQNLCVSSTSLGAIPSVLNMGFAASTGGSYQYQEIHDITITQSADLAITKSDGANTVTSGNSTTYTVTVTNNGPSAGDGAVLTDPTATGLTTTAVTCSVPTGSAAICPTASALTVANLQSGITIPTLPSGSSLNFSVTAKVTAASGTVTNTATIATSPSNPFITDPNPSNNSASDTDFVGSRTLITLQKNVVGRSAATDDFTVQIKNGGTVVASATTNGSANVNTVSTGAQVVTAGTAYTLTEIGAGTPAASLSAYTTTISCNNATTGSTTTLPNGNGQSYSLTPKSGDNVTCTLTNTPKVAQLTVVKTASATAFTVGQSAKYTVTVQNTGAATTSGNIAISDSLPTGITLTNTTGSAAGWSCTGTSTLTCTFTGTLGAGASTTLILNVAVGASATSGTNSATASGGGDGTCPSATRCTGATPNILITPAVNVAVTKTDNVGGAYSPGGTAIYTITVTNTGPSTAAGLVFNDPLPNGVTLNGTWTCSGAGGSLCGAGTSASGTSMTTLNGISLTIPAGTSPPNSSTAVTIQIPVAFSSSVGSY